MDFLSSVFDGLKYFLTNVLPLSPFRQYIEYLAAFPYLSWINWFIPLGTIASITATWLSAVTVYYAWIAILRWFRLIE